MTKKCEKGMNLDQINSKNWQFHPALVSLGAFAPDYLVFALWDPLSEAKSQLNRFFVKSILHVHWNHFYRKHKHFTVHINYTIFLISVQLVTQISTSQQHNRKSRQCFLVDGYSSASSLSGLHAKCSRAVASNRKSSFTPTWIVYPENIYKQFSERTIGTRLPQRSGSAN